MSQTPKLLLQVDEGRVAEAYDLCLKHLASAHRPGLLTGALPSIAISLLAVAAFVVGVLVWRGYI